MSAPLTGYILLDYLISGVIGGVAYIITAKYGWGEEAEIVRRLMFGAIAGFIVYITGMPNSFTALTGGFVGVAWLELLIKKFVPELMPEKPPVKPPE